MGVCVVSRCNEDEMSCVKNKPMFGREMSMSGVDVDSDSPSIRSHSAAVSRLRQLSRTFYQQRASASASSSSPHSPPPAASPTVESVPISLVMNK